MNDTVIRRLLALALISTCATFHQTGSAAADGLASPWVDGFNNKARLLAGKASLPGQKDSLFGALEIAMPPGWKTYWRAPGDAGGIPPEFDFSASENAAEVHVLYPVPHRLIDKNGTTVGYKDHAIFPVAVTAKDFSQPIVLKLKASYGVCKELCVPAEVELDLVIPPDAGPSNDIAAALPTVPRIAPIRGIDPVVSKWRVEMRGAKPVLMIESEDPAAIADGETGSDAFVDAKSGTYLPVPKKISDANGRAVFEVDLTDGADIKDLTGKPISITLIGGKGQSETTITLP
jgi:DsbC/DsbD-like thiol-disulfide interchange protein